MSSVVKKGKPKTKKAKIEVIEDKPKTQSISKPTKEYKKERVNSDNVIRRHDTQTREEINWKTVSEYAELMKEGVKFPPPTLIECGGEYYIVDGYHRILAMDQNWTQHFDAMVKPGDIKTAIFEATAANKTNGLTRTIKDKRKAVKLAMASELCKDWSARKIAEHCGVSNRFVSNIIKETNEQNDKGETDSPQEEEKKDEDKKADGITVYLTTDSTFTGNALVQKILESPFSKDKDIATWLSGFASTVTKAVAQLIHAETNSL